LKPNQFQPNLILGSSVRWLDVKRNLVIRALLQALDSIRQYLVAEAGYLMRRPRRQG
jgi:hypothetical protein